MDDSAVCSWPASRRKAARHVSRRAPSTRVAMSAILNWMAWNSAIAWPNCRRSRAYFIDASRQAWAMPTEKAAMPMRPRSRIRSVSMKPWPSAPRRFPEGMRQSSKTSSDVSDLLSPRQRREEAALLLVGAGEEDVAGAEAVVGGHGEGHSRIDSGQLLHHEGIVECRHARAAVLGGPDDTHEAELPQLRED